MWRAYRKFWSPYIESGLRWVLQGEKPFYKEIEERLCIAHADAVGEALTENIRSVTEQS